MLEASEKGADITKRWDATMDGLTREHHWELNGQVVPVDEPFRTSDGLEAMYPLDFGDPAEDCNCRCSCESKARWLLDVEETQFFRSTEGMSDSRKEEISNKLGITVEELDKYKNNIIPMQAKDYDDFRRQYEKIWNYDTVPRKEGE